MTNAERIQAWHSAFDTCHFKNEAVIREAHVRREPGVGGLVRQMVAHVREEAAPRAEAARDLNGFAEREMCRMRLLAQRVDHDDVEILEQDPRFVSQAVAV